MQGASLEQFKHLVSAVGLRASDVHITERLPESRAFELTFFQTLHSFCVGCHAAASAFGLFNLSQQPLVLLVEHADVALQVLCLALHVAVDAGPLILLLVDSRVIVVKLSTQVIYLVSVIIQVSAKSLLLTLESLYD